MAITNFSVNKIRLWADVGGVIIDVVKVQLDYALNAIPSAILHCAVGREVRSLLPSNVHGTIDQLRVTVPVIIWAQAFEASNSGFSGGPWPTDPFIVFAGLVTGVGYQRARSGIAALTIQCRHFLTGLEFSWTPTKAMQPLNPGNNRMQAGLRLNAGNPSFIVTTLAKQYFTRANITTDYWSQALSPWLRDICGTKQIFEKEALDQGNNDALASLARFEPFVEGVYRFGQPMVMNPFDIFNTEPGIRAMVADAANETARSFAGITIWEKLNADFGGRYLFKIIPMATRALVAPVIAGLRSIWTTLDPDEYESISLGSHTPRALRGTILYSGPNVSQTGHKGWQRGDALAIKTIGGRFENTNMAQGMLMFQDGPQWLMGVASPPAWGVHAAAPNGLRGNVARGAVGKGPQFPLPGALFAMAKPLWDAYAKALYLDTVFQHRTGSVTGRIRFDIAPGSSVAVVATEEKFVALSGQAVGIQIFYGIVTRVSTVIDSEAVQGYTAFEVSHLRDEAEFNDPNLTLDEHPLWVGPFPGAPLVEEFFAQPPPPVPL